MSLGGSLHEAPLSFSGDLGVHSVSLLGTFMSSLATTSRRSLTAENRLADLRMGLPRALVSGSLQGGGSETETEVLTLVSSPFGPNEDDSCLSISSETLNC